MSGCASGPRAEKSAGRPAESFAKETRSKRGGETIEESAERRVWAIAHFAAKIVVVTLVTNLIGVGVFVTGSRRAARNSHSA